MAISADRVQRMTSLVQVRGRMNAELRNTMTGKPELGIIVTDEVTVWGEIPEDASKDVDFVMDLIGKAKAQQALY